MYECCLNVLDSVTLFLEECEWKADEGKVWYHSDPQAPAFPPC